MLLLGTTIEKHLRSGDRFPEATQGRAKRYSKRVADIQDKKFTFHIAKSPVYIADEKGGLETSIRFRDDCLMFAGGGIA
jgi:hypothetical protein